MDDAALSHLKTFPRRAYEKGDFIIRQGEPASHVFYLAEGACVRNSFSLRGDEITYGERIADGSASCLLGALTLYTDKRIHDTNFVAKTRCACYVVPEDAFLDFLNNNVEVLHDLVRLALRSYVELNANFHAKLKGLAPARIASYLLAHMRQSADGNELDCRLNMSALGRELGMHRITVGKIIRAFDGEGLVAFRGNSLVLLDPTRLQRYADGASTINYQTDR